MKLQVGEGVELELLNLNHAAALLQLRNSNYEHLVQWLSWVDGMQTVEHFEDYICRCRQRYNEKLEVPLAIVVNGELAGRIGLNYFDINNAAAIGYWLGKKFEGRGVITKACQAIIDYGFTERNLNRIEIKCAAGNVRSQAVPERLGFTKEGLLRQAELLKTGYVDLYIYSLLRQEWETKK